MLKIKKNIFVIRIPEIQFTMLFLTLKHDGNEIIKIFNGLEECLQGSFNIIIPYILTDRDTAFTLFDQIEAHPETGEIRTRIFYCDPMASYQKPHVENVNAQLRRFFPKKASVDHLTQQDVCKINFHLNDEKVRTLSGYSPNEAFRRVYGELIIHKLQNFLASYK